MAESPHDDLSDALARMAQSDFATVEPEEAPPVSPLQASPQQAAPMQAAPVQSSPTRAVRPANTRAAVQPPRPVAPAAGASSGASSAARPVTPPRTRPAAPTLSSAAPPAQPAPTLTPAPAPTPTAALSLPPAARKIRPSAPTVRSVAVPIEPSQSEAAGDQSTALSGEVVEDDESAMVVPYMSGPAQPSNAVAEARARAARQKKLNFRKTLIPILLTSGVLLIGFASLKFLASADSMLTDMPIWIPVILILLAGMFLSLAAVNMMSVKNFKP